MHYSLEGEDDEVKEVDISDVAQHKQLTFKSSTVVHHLGCFPLPSTFVTLDDLCQHLFGWNELEDNDKLKYTDTFTKNWFGDERIGSQSIDSVFPPFTEKQMKFETVPPQHMTRGKTRKLSLAESSTSEKSVRTSGRRKGFTVSTELSTSPPTKRTRSSMVSKDISQA